MGSRWGDEGEEWGVRRWGEEGVEGGNGEVGAGDVNSSS